MRAPRLMAVLLTTIAMTLGGCAERVATPISSQSQEGVTLTYVEGNPTCADLGLGTLSFKVDPPHSGTYAIDDYNSVTITTVDGVYVDWSATLGIDAVIVKGGDNANVYLYDPEGTSDYGLHSPINPNNGTPYGLSHIELCFDYEVTVSKTASTSLTRTWGWTIEKFGAHTQLTLAPGQTFMEPYTVTVWSTGSADSDWAMAGTITVENRTPLTATVTGVSDSADGVVAAVDCGVTFPVTLAPGASLACTYAAALPDRTDRTNVAAVATVGDVGPGAGSAAVSFASPTVNAVDECIAVTDSLHGALGTVCSNSPLQTFTYTQAIGPYAECGEYEVTNTATFVANDTGATGANSWLIAVHVPCPTIGCTLTPGYWKTHSENGPAPYDDTWALLPDGASTIFYLSNQSYYDVLWTAPRGNVYYILAHAYVAAALNHLNGAGFTAAQTAYDQATQLFLTYTPNSNLSKATRSTFIHLAGVLDAYNNGLIGPGHCSE